MELTVETFEGEITEALKAYDKFIVCIDKTPDECRASLVSLMEKAIKTYASAAGRICVMASRWTASLRSS